LEFQHTGLPDCLNLVVHPHGCCLVDTDHHSFATVSSAQEVINEITCNRVETFIPSDEVVSRGWWFVSIIPHRGRPLITFVFNPMRSGMFMRMSYRLPDVSKHLWQ
jgi:hypothetical protein